MIDRMIAEDELGDGTSLTLASQRRGADYSLIFDVDGLETSIDFDGVAVDDRTVTFWREAARGGTLEAGSIENYALGAVGEALEEIGTKEVTV